MATVDPLTDRQWAELKRELGWSATGTDLFERIDAIRTQNTALIRRVERLTAALTRCSTQCTCEPPDDDPNFHMPFCMTIIAREALKEETDSVG